MKTEQLSHLLILERVETVPDGSGGFSEAWLPVGSVWAKVLPGTRNVAATNEFSPSSISYQIIVRASEVGSDERPVSGQRFRDGIRIYEILAVTERDPGGAYLTCFTRGEVSN